MLRPSASAAGLMARIGVARQFDCKWKPIKVADDVDNVAHIVRSRSSEPWAGRDGMFDEDMCGWSFHCDRWTGALFWNRKRPNGPHLLPRESEYFAASGKNGRTSGHQLRRRSESDAMVPRRCSQLSSTSSERRRS